MVTLKDLAEDWINARALLKQQIKVLSDPTFPHTELPKDIREALALRINKAINEFNALLKEFPHT